MYIKEERICSSKFVQLLIKYFFFTLLLICLTAGILILDGYLKTIHAKVHPERAIELQETIRQQADHDALAFGFVPDYTAEEFDPIMCVSWTHLMHFVVMELIMIANCVKSELARAILARSKIIHIEVLDKSQKLQRIESKRNLNTVVETFQKQRNYALFDKFWYLKRAERYYQL